MDSVTHPFSRTPLNPTLLYLQHWHGLLHEASVIGILLKGELLDQRTPLNLQGEQEEFQWFEKESTGKVLFIHCVV